MKIYLAARYSRFPEMQHYARVLRAQGHEVTSRWIHGDHDRRAKGQSEAAQWMAHWAEEDWQDLCASETCISFTEGPENVPGRGRGGRHTEHGIALAYHKRCIVVGFRENVFHWLPQNEFYATWEACLAAIQPVVMAQENNQ